MWREKLIELKAKSGLSIKEIAKKADVPEPTVKRVFHGITENPSIDTLLSIAKVFGTSLDEIFAESDAVVASESLVALQTAMSALQLDLDEKNKHIDALLEEIDEKNKHITSLLEEVEKHKHTAELLSSENNLQKSMLADKAELIMMQREIITHYHKKFTCGEGTSV